MINDIGLKIKTLAKCLCWIGIASSVLFGVVLFKQIGLLLSIIIIILGSISSWFGSFLMYGFGELVDSTTKIDNKLKDIQDCSKYEALRTLKESGIISEHKFSEESNNFLLHSLFKR